MVVRKKTCPNCGNEIPLKEEICRYCFANLRDDEFLLKNHGSFNYSIEKLKTENPKKQVVKKEEVKPIKEEPEKKETISNVLPIRRLFLLIVFTGGLYNYYWFYKNCKKLNELGENITPIFRTIWFIIPVARWVVYYDLLSLFKKHIDKRNITSFNVFANFLLYFFVPILGFWSIINVQEAINDLWRYEQPNAIEQRSLTQNELAVIILFIVIYLLFILSIIFVLSNFILLI